MALIGSLMRIDHENGLQTRNHETRIARLVDRDFDLLRLRVWERSDWIARMHRVQTIASTMMAFALGGVMGWLLMR